MVCSFNDDNIIIMEDNEGFMCARARRSSLHDMRVRHLSCVESLLLLFVNLSPTNIAMPHSVVSPVVSTRSLLIVSP